jgi:XRE family aerobic/anaerobic benzoate catabolism transcriptional regulator
MSSVKGQTEGESGFEDDEFLQGIGSRIRDLRAERGMTRKILARDSGVSERYLADLENGQGNISIVRLRDVAAALGMPLQEVITTGPEQAPELTLLIQYLCRLSPTQVAEARELLHATFGSKMRRYRIALIGLRGAGKTTLGQKLAAYLEVPFVELGREIENEAGVALSEIFSLYGQSVYRRYERRAIKSVQDKYERCVLSPGGSIVSEVATFDELLSGFHTIWIKASPEEHMARVAAQGDYRPMTGNQEAMKDLERILARREAMYVKADAIVDTTGQSIEESFEALKAALPK